MHTLNLLAALALLLLNAFFVAAEFAIVKVRETRIRELKDTGGHRAKVAHELVTHLDAYLSATQLGITLASLGLGWVSEAAFAERLVPVLDRMGIVSEAAVHTVATTLAFLLVTGLHIVIGELAPKSLAIQRAEGVTLWIAVPMRFFYRVSFPALWLLNHSANFILRLVGLQPASSLHDTLTADELRMVVAASHKGGVLSDADQELLENVFSFASRQVREVMAPRGDVYWLDARLPFQENMRIIVDSGHTRFPLCDGELDQVLGLVHIKDVFLRMEAGDREPNLLLLKHPVVAIPVGVSLQTALRDLRRRRVQLAVVVDEYGSVAGVVTIEDLIEEIVGEIEDEFDEPHPDIEIRDDGRVVVAGRTPIADINEAFELDLGGETYVTMAGLVLDQLGRTAQVGDAVDVPGAHIRVEQVDGLRITRLVLELVKPESLEERDRLLEEQEERERLREVEEDPGLIVTPPELGPPPSSGGNGFGRTVPDEGPAVLPAAPMPDPKA